MWLTELSSTKNESPRPERALPALSGAKRPAAKALSPLVSKDQPANSAPTVCSMERTSLKVPLSLHPPAACQPPALHKPAGTPMQSVPEAPSESTAICCRKPASAVLR